MNLRTANHNRKRADRLKASKDAYEFDMAQIAKCERSGNWARRRNTGFVKRSAARSKVVRKEIAAGTIRPWDGFK